MNLLLVSAHLYERQLRFKLCHPFVSDPILVKENQFPYVHFHTPVDPSYLKCLKGSFYSQGDHRLHMDANRYVFLICSTLLDHQVKVISYLIMDDKDESIIHVKNLWSLLLRVSNFNSHHVKNIHQRYRCALKEQISRELNGKIII